MAPKKVCVLCRKDVDDEKLYAKIHVLKPNIVAHHFCLLLSDGLWQNGADNEGIQGFLEADILQKCSKEKSTKCCYCNDKGATVRCCQHKCRKVFHLPCGRLNGSLHQFYKYFRSYCIAHRPCQMISPDALMEIKDEDLTCKMCHDDIKREDCLSILWASCCKKDGWFHRNCVQSYAIQAGYFFTCPLCKNKKIFRKAMSRMGIYIPNRNASWALEDGAFEELHHHNDANDDDDDTEVIEISDDDIIEISDDDIGDDDISNDEPRQRTFTRLKGSTNGLIRIWDKHQKRLYIMSKTMAGKKPEEIHAMMMKKIGEYAMCKPQIKKWFANFKRGHFCIFDAPRRGRPKKDEKSL